MIADDVVPQMNDRLDGIVEAMKAWEVFHMISDINRVAGRDFNRGGHVTTPV
jgi:hypothetical protein